MRFQLPPRCGISEGWALMSAEIDRLEREIDRLREALDGDESDDDGYSVHDEREEEASRGR